MEVATLQSMPTVRLVYKTPGYILYIFLSSTGPWSHLFTGVYEQSTLPYMMGFASCLGPGITYCDLKPKPKYNP